MLLLLLAISFGQTIDYKVLKTDVVNSQNYQFPNKFVSELIPHFSKKPVVLLEKDGDKIKEVEVGEVVCLQLSKDGWLVAKAVLKQDVPKNYVMRVSFKVLQYHLNSGCSFVIEKADINKFIILSPLFASSFEPTNTAEK